MAKGKATTAKGKGKAHAKAPPKKAMPSKNTAPKKAPACPHNTKGKGSHKQAADDLDDASLGESSREEEDPRPQKKHCGKQKEISDEEGGDGEEPDDKAMQVDDKGEAGSQSDSKVSFFQVITYHANGK